jgi:hypothetical protein
MKNTIIFIVFLTIISMYSAAFAQNAPIDFETGGYGADWTWTVFENDTNPPVEIISNPDPSGDNTSATVAQFTALVTGQPWAGCETMHGEDIGTFDIDASNSTIKIMVWKPVISNVGIKLVKPDGWALPEILVPNTVVNQWEELTFNFIGQAETGYDQIVIFPDFDMEGREQDNVCYFDNITFHPFEVSEGPEVAAADPTHPEANVFSIYSDVYTDLEGTNFNPNWGQSTVVTVDYPVDGNNTLKYENLNYQGTNLGSTDGGVPQDVSAYEYLHVDFWTDNSTALNFYVIDQSDGEVFYALPITFEEWVSVDIPLSHFTDGGEDMTDVHQFKVDGNGTIWFDNWYFWTSGSDADDNAIAPNNGVLDQNYPNPFNPVTTIDFSISQPGQVTLEVYDTKGRLVETLVNGIKAAASYQHVWNAENVASGLYFYRLSVDGRTIDTKRMVLLK